MLHMTFEETAAAYPERIAIQYENEKPFTYKQINTQANQLAHVLLQKKINIKDPVVVQLNRTPEQVIALLALWKIGAIYIPLSEEQPENRLKQVVIDCAPQLIITNSLFANAEPLRGGRSDLPILFLDEEKAGLEKQKIKNPLISGLNNNLIAYIAYSSGSTGSPKGIPIKHAGMTQYWEDILKTQIAHRAPRVLANVSIDFDAHIWEYLMAWTFGSALYLTNNETRKDSKRLAQFIIKHQVTDMTLTPAVLRTFTDAQISAFGTHGLKAVYSTGDACTLDIVKQFAKHGIKIFNCYGPTEATFGVSMLHCKAEDFYQNMAPIGLPPPDSKVSVKILGETGQEAKEGEAGELVIYSPYLTPGYINAKNDSFSKKTAYTQSTGLIGYRTGDKFIQQGGLLYYSGRAHHLAHIKIRGQLVDITGIEGVLRNHPAIQDVCVIIRQDLGKEPVLVAFTVNNGSLSNRELRQHCRCFLSMASIPSYFIHLAELPLNSSGKIDRDDLTKREFIFQRDKDTPYLLARTELEKKLLAIWVEVLAIPDKLGVQLGMKDSFNSLGGDSIKAMLLVAKICSVFDIELSITKIGSLEDLTIEALANTIFMELTKKNVSYGIQLAKEGDEDLEPLFIMPPVSGESSLTYQKLISALKTPRKVYVINSPALLNSMITSPAINDIAASYLNLMRKIQPNGLLNIAGWSSGGLLAYEIAVQTERQGKSANFVGIIDEPAPSVDKEMSCQIFAHELMDLIGYFGKQHGFSIDIEIDVLARLSKEKQIESVFSKIPTLSSISQNILAHIKNFLLASLRYEPEKLKMTTVTIFSTQPTRKKVLSSTKNKVTIETLGWENYSPVCATFSNLNGDHFFIIENPKELASQIDCAVHPQSRVESKKTTTEKSLEECLARIERTLGISGQESASSSTFEKRLARIEQRAIALQEQKLTLSNKLTERMSLFRKKRTPDNQVYPGLQHFKTKVKAKL